MDFFNKVTKASKVVIDKGVEVGKTVKTQINIVTIESQINNCKKKIGDIVYKEKVKIKNEDIKKAIEKIDKLMKDIEKLRNE